MVWVTGSLTQAGSRSAQRADDPQARRHLAKLPELPRRGMEADHMQSQERGSGSVVYGPLMLVPEIIAHKPRRCDDKKDTTHFSPLIGPLLLHGPGTGELLPPRQEPTWKAVVSRQTKKSDIVPQMPTVGRACYEATSEAMTSGR